MPAVWNPQANAIFLQVLEQPTAEREALLQQACGGDDALAAQVRSLLAASEQAGSFLDSPAIDAPPTLDQSQERAGTQIGPYRLIEQIGEGGMGTVWMAQQTEPVKRLVAVKLIKAGMDSRQVIARFEAERQALALMDHTSIARVLDGGTTLAGRPYFVMDLVRGVPITRYCDEHHLTPRQRLELFIPVCQAIQHAHQKGIIHRDLKPSNVLVALYDGQPVPKVIDFGVAKAAGQSLTEKTLVTGFGSIVGTLEYMSPEQAEINQLDIDTRSDIYSLGVLLYELLAGSPPFSRTELENAGMLEMLRVIREEEPSKPSTKLSTAEGLPTLAANRGTEPAKLTKLIRGELDWIVMKALEKDRSRRYETANGIAMDVQRYLADEPVQACSPSVAYRLRKFARRNRVALGTIALVGISLVAAAAVSAWQAVRATRAEGLARLEAGRASDEAAIAKAFNDFLIEDLLAQAHPRNEPDRDIKLRTLVERAAEKVESRFRDQPLVEAAIRHTLGTIYISLGDYYKAEEQLRRAIERRRQQLGPEHHATLWSMTNLAYALGPQNRYEEAEKIHTDVLEIKRRFLDSEDPSMLLNLRGIASSYRGQGRLAEAEKLHREVYEVSLRVLGPEDHQTLQSKTYLAQTILMQGRYAEAEKMLREVVEIRKRLLRPEHPDWLMTMSILAQAIRDQDRLAEAEGLYEEVYEIRKRVLGPEHFRTQQSLHVLTNVKKVRLFMGVSKPHWDEGVAWSNKGFELFDAGRRQEAADHLRQSITALGNVADELKLTQEYRRQLGKCYIGLVSSSSDPEEKKLMLSRALPLWEQLATDFPESKWIWSELGEVYALLGQWQKAADAQTKEIELNADYWVPWYRRGLAHDGLGQWDNAVADLTRLLELKPDYGWGWWIRGQAHLHLKQWAKALTDCDRAIELGVTVRALWLAKAAAHARLNQPDSAIAALQQAVAKGFRNANRLKNQEDFAGLRERKDFEQLVNELEDMGIAAEREAVRLKPDDPVAQSDLGVALAKQGKLDEAIAAFRKALKLDPKNARAANNLALGLNNHAWALAAHTEPARRDPDRAVSLATEAVELQPENGGYWNTLGFAQYRAGASKDAIAALEKSMELRKGGNSEDWFFLAMAHWQLGEKEKAREWYDRAVEWMDKNRPTSEELRRFRAEAEELTKKEK